jgi:deazaflavin-dependent oxidoreductase (nitroreductase family)
VGRSSGRPYETPVAAFPTASGFVVALPYGRGAEWCKNLLAAGGGTVRYAGATVAVRDPAFLDRDQALAALDGLPRAVFSRLPLDDFLRLEREPDPGSGPGVSGGPRPRPGLEG